MGSSSGYLPEAGQASHTQGWLGEHSHLEFSETLVTSLVRHCTLSQWDLKQAHPSLPGDKRPLQVGAGRGLRLGSPREARAETRQKERWTLSGYTGLSSLQGAVKPGRPSESPLVDTCPLPPARTLHLG